MDNKYCVKVVYKNKELEPIYTKTYSLADYTEMLRSDLLRLISDVEDMAYDLNGGISKSQWSDKTWDSFYKIKHKLLDKAGEIQRLPENLCIDGADHTIADDSSLSAIVADIYNNG